VVRPRQGRLSTASQFVALCTGACERQRAGADRIVELVFDRIVRVEAGSRFRGFRPQVRNVVASAELQAN
jgi:hypothetical protein